MSDDRRFARRLGPRDERGFTLVEVLVAGLVLLIGILGTAKLAASSESTTLDAELQQIATEQAQRALEEARSLDYAEVGDAVLPTQQPADADVIAGGQFSGPDTDEPEEIVTPATGAPAAAIEPVRTFTVDHGEGRTVSGTIYTFVSWRNEDCGGLSLLGNPQLDGAVDELEALSSQLGATQERVADATDSLTTRVISRVPSAGALKSELDDLQAALVGASQSIEARIDELNALLATGVVDLCDIDDAVFEDLGTLLALDLSDVSEIADDLAAIDGELDDLIGSALISLCNGPTGLLCTTAVINQIVNYLINPLLTALDGTGPTTPTDALEALTATLDELPAIDTDLLDGDAFSNRNTKRVSVAVTIDSIAREDITPKNPVWLSSVITDPRDGLLGVAGVP